MEEVERNDETDLLRSVGEAGGRYRRVREESERSGEFSDRDDVH